MALMMTDKKTSDVVDFFEKLFKGRVEVLHMQDVCKRIVVNLTKADNGRDNFDTVSAENIGLLMGFTNCRSVTVSVELNFPISDVVTYKFECIF